MNAPHTILVPIDFSMGARAALQQAARMAALHGAAVHVLHVVDNFAVAMAAESRGETFDNHAARAVDGARAALQPWIEHSGISMPVETSIIVDSPLNGILNHAREFKPDLVIAGVAGSGNTTTGAGSVACKLARKLLCNVLLVRPDHPGAFQKVIACIDLSDSSRRVAEHASRIARQDGASVVFAHVLHEPWMAMPYWEIPIVPESMSTFSEDHRRRALKSCVADFAKETDSLEVVVGSNNCATGIAELATRSNADLVVVGAKGRTNLRYVLLGSTAEHLLTRSPRSLLVVKPPG